MRGYQKATCKKLAVPVEEQNLSPLTFRSSVVRKNVIDLDESEFFKDDLLKDDVLSLQPTPDLPAVENSVTPVPYKYHQVEHSVSLPAF